MLRRPLDLCLSRGVTVVLATYASLTAALQLAQGALKDIVAEVVEEVQKNLMASIVDLISHVAVVGHQVA